MPRLRERSDGCYYIVHHYRDCHTWQIDRDGVNFLRKLNINADDTFPTEVFMLMWEHRLVYLVTVGRNTGAITTVDEEECGRSLFKLVGWQ